MSTDESVGDAVSIWTLFSHADIYVMAIGLFIPAWLGIFCCYLFLVPTCQISAPTFTTRFYVIYCYGWKCRGSTHLQMWWWGLTAYSKASGESCPAYGVGTYMDRELTEAKDTVKSSSCIQIIGYNQNLWNAISTSDLFSDLGLDQLQHP